MQATLPRRPAHRRAYRFNAYQRHADTIMAEMNTTPLIDVLLVLLVMLILAVPLSPHVLPVDLPQPGGAASTAPQVTLTIDPQGQAYWNGAPVTRAQLQARLASAAQQNPQPVIRFQPDPQASYDASVQVIALVGDAGLTRFAFAGNEAFRNFGKD